MSQTSCILVPCPIKSLPSTQSSGQAMHGSRRSATFTCDRCGGEACTLTLLPPFARDPQAPLPGTAGALPGEGTIFAEAVRLSIDGPVKTTHTFVPGIQVDRRRRRGCYSEPSTLRRSSRSTASTRRSGVDNARRATAEAAGWSGSTTTRASTTAPAGAVPKATSGSWMTDMPTVNTTSTRRPLTPLTCT